MARPRIGNETTPNQDMILEGDLVIRDVNSVDRIRLDRETGGLFVKDEDGNVILHLEFPGQVLRFGGHGRDADLVMFAREATSLTDDAKAVLHVDTDRGLLRLGAAGRGGQVVCRDDQGEQTILLNADRAMAVLGANGKHGEFFIQSDASRPRIRMRAENARADIGGAGADGELRLRMGDGKTSVRVRAQGGDPGPVATLDVGGGGALGAISIRDADGDLLGQMSASGVLVMGGGQGPDGGIILNAQGAIGVRISGNGELKAGAVSTGGKLLLHRATDLSGNPGAQATIVAHADSGTLRLGGGAGGNIHGELDIRSRHDNQTIHLDGENATITVGTSSTAGTIRIKDDNGDTSIHIDGEAGDIKLANGDVAEEFALAVDHTVEPGALLVLDDDAKLRPCERAYDPRVVGIAAGAGGTKPAIVLGRCGGGEPRVALALCGKVYCKVNGELGAIAVGDLLTTSPTLGHAMKADPQAANGTIVGKALAPLAAGRALIPVLVTLR